MEHLLTTLNRIREEKHLPALLIGGHAVTALGHPRATFDVDLLIPRSAASGWREELGALGYMLFAENSNFLQFEPKPDWPLPPIDLMLVDEDVFGALQSGQVESQILPTPSAPSLIALKLHAIRQSSRERAEQDWSDILALVDAHDLSLDDPDFAAIVLRHGGEAAIDRIREHADR